MAMNIVVADKVLAEELGVEIGTPLLYGEEGCQKVDGRIVARSGHYDGNNGHVEFYKDGRWHYTWARFTFKQEVITHNSSSSFRRTADSSWPRYVQGWGDLSLVAAGAEAEFFSEARKGAILFFLSHELSYGNWTNSRKFDFLLGSKWEDFKREIKKVPPRYRRTHLSGEVKLYLMGDMSGVVDNLRFLPILPVLEQLCSDVEFDQIDTDLIEELLAVDDNLDLVMNSVSYPVVGVVDLTSMDVFHQGQFRHQLLKTSRQKLLLLVRKARGCSYQEAKEVVEGIEFTDSPFRKGHPAFFSPEDAAKCVKEGPVLVRLGVYGYGNSSWFRIDGTNFVVVPVEEGGVWGIEERTTFPRPFPQPAN